MELAGERLTFLRHVAQVLQSAPLADAPNADGLDLFLVDGEPHPTKAPPGHNRKPQSKGSEHGEMVVDFRIFGPS